MASPASIQKHPLHPMLIVFPIGLWVFSLICDIIFRLTGHPAWIESAYYTLWGGTIGALLAAIPGFIDYLSIKDRHIKSTATLHMAINLSLVFLYTINIWLRVQDGLEATLPFLISIVGNVLLVVSGWLGGELVYVHGVAVDTPRPKTPAPTRTP